MPTVSNTSDEPITTFEANASFKREIDFPSIATAIWSKKVLFLKTWAACVVGGIVVAFLLPVYYSSETQILPPLQNQSTTSMLLGQFSPFADLTNKNLILKNPSDIYVELLESRTVADAIIKRFDLQKIYKEKKLSDTRKELAKHSTVLADKDGVIHVTVEDKVPSRAADIANAYLDELFKLNQELAVTEASQRRLFFAKELDSARADLSKAEVNLKNTQESTGLIQLDSQSKAIIESVAILEGQVAAKEVEVQSMQSFATDQNAEYLRARRELAAMQAQLAKTRQSSHVQEGDILVPTGKVPTAGLEYARRLRDLKYYESMFEVIAKQYEIARIDEAKAAPVLQVIDRAVEADKRSRPERLVVVLVSAVLGLFVAIAITLNERRISISPSSTELPI